MLINNLILGAAAEGAGFLDRLNGGDILFQLVAFLLLMVLLKKFAWGPLMGIMKERENHIAGEIESAEQSRIETKKLLEEQRELLKETRNESATLIENAKKQAEMQREEIIALAKQESDRLKESAKQEIEQQKEQAVAAIREQVASLSILVASKVIEKEITEADQAKFINDIIQEAGKGQ